MHPGRVKGGDLVVDRAPGFVCTGQVAGGHQKFADNFAPGKNEGLFEKLYPLLFAARMVGIQPGGKGAMFLADLHQAAGIFNRCRNFAPVADDPGIRQQARAIRFAVGGDSVDVKAVIRR